jgi:BirA family biotin operon repressor/biotin-[acetyl-CoA-carboxylase] ligase
MSATTPKPDPLQDLPSDYRLSAHDSIDSTSAEARRAAEAGAPGNLVVWSLEQTAGRGRRGRDWNSPPGNLYASLLLRPAVPAARAGELSILGAVAAADAVTAMGGRAVSLKWPNDVLAGGRKVAGVLTESAAGAGQGLDWVVIGCGINLISHPAETRWPATNLVTEGAMAGMKMSPREGLALLIRSFDDWLLRWATAGFAPVVAAWTERAYGRDTEIEISTPQGIARGRVAGLAADGALLVDTAAGRRTIHSGEVQHREAASCC